MDGLRKVPDNVPNKDMLAAHLGKPLTSVPDPFDNEYPSFAAHNNARLRRFLDRFGFEYEFLSATECYKAGLFDATLMQDARGLRRGDGHHPADPGPRAPRHLLAVPAGLADQRPGAAGADGRAQRRRGAPIVYVDPDTGKKVETPVTGGRVKCQWKADWALRWTALGVDYEMCGKDLIDSVTLSSKICRALGGMPPESFIYELFLDDQEAARSPSPRATASPSTSG